MGTSPQTKHDQPESAPAPTVWVYLFGFAVCVVGMFLLPPPFSSLMLIALALGSIGWGMHRLSRTVGLAPTIRDALPHLPQSVLRLLRRVSRDAYAAGFGLLGFVLMIAATLDLRPLNEQTLIGYGAAKMIAGGLAVGVAVRLSTRLPALAKPLDVPLDKLRRRWWFFAGVGTLLMITLAEINGQVLHLPVLTDVSSRVQFAMLLSGVLLVGYGFGGAPVLRLHLPRAASAERATIIALGAIIALALFLRLWDQAGTIRYLIDELHWSDAIIAVETRPTLQILTPMSAQSPYTWVFPYFQSGAVALLGHNFVGFRFTSAITGTLNVLAIYGLAEAIFDRKTALLSALVLATFPPHVQFSRVAMTLIADPLFGTLALMFVARALKNNRRIEWALAGISLGMTQYFYEGGRLLFPPLLIGFVILLALRGQMRGKWRGFGITLLTALIVGAPFYYTLIANGKPLFGRYNDSGLGASYWQQFAGHGITLGAVLDQIQHTLTSFMIYGAHADMSVYYGGQQALVLDYLLPFFLFGCFYLAWRYPSLAFLIPLWIVATGVGNGLLRDTLVSARYYVVVPALAVAIAAGVRYLLPFFWRDPQPDADGTTRRDSRLRRALPVVAVGAIATAQIGYYFGPHLAYFNVQVRDAKPYRDGIDAANRAADLPGNTQVYLVGKPDHDQNVPRDWLGFLSRDGDPMRYFPLRSVTPDTISAKYLLDLPRGVNYAFFVDPNDTNVLGLLYRYFPGVSPAQYSPWDIPAHKEYVLFYVPADSIPQRPPRKP